MPHDTINYMNIISKRYNTMEAEQCIESLIAIFKKYAGKKGWCSLSRTEFLTFINTELAVLIKNRKDTGVLDCMMKKLDIDCDGQLDFQEFLTLTELWRDYLQLNNPHKESNFICTLALHQKSI